MYKESGLNNVGTKATENIYLCPDGKYRWVYEFPMLKNPIILLTVWKIFGFIFLGIIVFLFLLELFDGNVKNWAVNFFFTPQFFILPGILFGLSLISYFILAVIYGFKYMVLFEMDDERVLHIQMDKQFKKAKALSWLTAMAGMASGNITTMGIGITSGIKNSSESKFNSVRRVMGHRGLNTIRLNGLLNRNQVYAGKEDYDFVWDYIVKKCTKAEIKE